LDFAGQKKFFKLGGKVVCPVGDVEVTYGQDENHVGRVKVAMIG